MSRYEDIA